MKSISILAAATLFALAIPAQNLVLPDNHYLGESPTQAETLGSVNWWGTTAAGRRMMVLYEASHFTGKAGVAGPIVITKLSFRAEGGEKNTGGQTYSGVNVNVYKTTLTSTTMATGGSNTVFASNLAPTAGNTTTLLGSVPVGTVVAAPSLGTVPNNYMMELPLVGLGAFDPLGDAAGETNLLVDITWTGYVAGPAIPPSVTVVPMADTEDTTAKGAGIRGRGIYAASPTATSGTASTAPPVIGVEFSGGGGYPTLIPATAQRIGAACGGAPSTFYQLFVHGERFDLDTTIGGMTLVPDSPTAPTIYTVLPSAPPVDLTKINATPNTTTDDLTLAAQALGFTLNYPGGSTAAVRPCTNGFVWLDTAMSAVDFTPSLTEWLGNTSTTPYTARVAPFWHDFVASRNTTSHPGCGLHALAVPETSPGAGDATYWVTWLNMGELNTPLGVGGQSVNTFQCVFHQSGNIEYRYGAMSLIQSATSVIDVMGIVGFTRGRIAGVNSVDPQSRDLSHELPFQTSPEGSSGHVSFTTVSTPVAAGATYGARMFGGQSITFNVGNVPAAPISLGIINLDLAVTMPGLQLPGLTAPQCMLSTGIPPLIFGWESWLTGTSSSFTGTLPLVIPHSWLGVVISGQAIGIDLTGGPHPIPWASNTVRWVVGLD